MWLTNGRSSDVMADIFRIMFDFTVEEVPVGNMHRTTIILSVKGKEMVDLLHKNFENILTAE